MASTRGKLGVLNPTPKERPYLLCYLTIQTLATLVESLPIGTNLGLLHFLWMLVSGHLLASCGALFPALQATGLGKEAVRRAWAAFRYGE